MIKVYGADWCGDTKRAIQYLESVGVEYDYIDVEADAKASDWVKSQNDGKEKKPTIDVGGKILSVPSDTELHSVLREKGLISS